jgi:hypothetical protein
VGKTTKFWKVNAGTTTYIFQQQKVVPLASYKTPMLFVFLGTNYTLFEDDLIHAPHMKLSVCDRKNEGSFPFILKAVKVK